MKIMTFSILLLAASLLLAACAVGNSQAIPTQNVPTVIADQAIVTEGRLEPIRHTDIALNASGLVSEVMVVEGEEVTAGQVIARLENSEAQTLESALANALQELTNAYQEVRDTQFKLDNFDVPAEFSGMTPGKAVERTLTKLNEARKNFEPYKNLNEKQLETTQTDKQIVTYKNVAKLYKKQLDDAWAKYRKAIQWLELESNLENATARLVQAQKDYDGLNDPSFAEETAGVRAALANAEVRAPFAGVITNLDLKVGEFAASGNPVVTIADLSSWVVKTTDLTEIDVVNIKIEQPVSITLDAIPGVTLNGIVLAVGQNFSEKQGDIVYEVTVQLSDKHPGMRWGMTAEVKFEP